MYGADPGRSQGQHEQQQRRSTEGGRQYEGTQWDQPEGQQPQRTQRGERQQPQQRREAPQPRQQFQPRQQPQQFTAGGAATRQPSQQFQGATQGQQPIQQGQGIQTQQQPGQRRGGVQTQQRTAQRAGGMQTQQRTAQPGAGMQTQQRVSQQPQRAGGFPSTRGAQLQAITLEEISRSEVVTVAPDDSIRDVVVEMADRDVGSVVVVDDGEPLGVLTDRRIALALGDVPDLAERTAGDLLGGDVVTGTQGMTVYEAVRMLRDEGIRRLPIVDDRGTLAGIVTLDDLVVLIAGELGAAAEVIERQAPPR